MHFQLQICLGRILASVAGLVVASSVMAELPPTAYLSGQDLAGDWLQIEVLSTWVDTTYGVDQGEYELEVSAVARILAVYRTSTEASSGDTISIQYASRFHGEGWVGPSRIPVLVEGVKCPAYLTGKGDGIYSPAARSYSFRQVRGLCAFRPAPGEWLSRGIPVVGEVLSVSSDSSSFQHFRLLRLRNLRADSPALLDSLDLRVPRCWVPYREGLTVGLTAVFLISKDANLAPVNGSIIPVPVSELPDEISPENTGAVLAQNLEAELADPGRSRIDRQKAEALLSALRE